MYRVGIGYDIHRFKTGRKLFLGGVEIPSTKGLMGHSDADVVLHAVCDALLGAIGAGDIGQLFPNTDVKYKNISSLILLKNVAARCLRARYKIVNVDIMLLLEAPKIVSFTQMMRKHIARRLGIHVDDVGVKATTNEGLGPVGRGQAAAAYAVVSVRKVK